MSKNEIRFKRYRDKIEYIIENIEDLPIEPKNKIEIKGIFYSIQTSIEALIDIIAMAVKDLGFSVKDDSSNVDVLVGKLKLDKDMGVEIKKANGLRNILVHRYNGVSDEIALGSVKEVKEILYKWIKVIEGVLNDLKGTD